LGRTEGIRGTASIPASNGGGAELESASRTGLIVGASLAILVLIAIAVALFLFLRRREKESQSLNGEMDMPTESAAFLTPDSISTFLNQLTTVNAPIDMNAPFDLAGLDVFESLFSQ
jgi:hypothetical protein